MNDNKKVEQENFELNVELTHDEREFVLKDIRKRIIRCLYVYEQMMLNKEGYNYKVYLNSLILFVLSSNYLFHGKLINIAVNLNILLQNELEKKQIKSILFECVNNIDFLLKEGDSDGESC
jgi:hypothetical protein